MPQVLESKTAVGRHVAAEGVRHMRAADWLLHSLRRRAQKISRHHCNTAQQGSKVGTRAGDSGMAAHASNLKHKKVVGLDTEAPTERAFQEGSF